MAPLVSVLMPCFNAQRFVAAALESVLVQTYSQIEIIVVDDGSTDRSIDIMRSYIRQGVKVIQQNNRGASAARNVAFSKSAGEVVLFMDADDLIAPRHIEALVERVAWSQTCVGTSEIGFFINHPGHSKLHHPSYSDLDGASWLVTEWADARVNSFQPGMFLIPRQLVEQVGGWNENLPCWEDVEFFARTLLASAGTLFSPGACLYYRDTVGSLSTRRDRSAAESHFLAVSLGAKHLLSTEDSDRTRRACADMFQDFEYTYFPHYSDLRANARERVERLGGSNLTARGSPRFHKLRGLIGWRAALLVQNAHIKLRKISMSRCW
jgi:glycosyltransferase involved in cell wall biosynthesis